jgi:hypothetical protein
LSEERLIWRPNEIPLEEWEAMPREEQIRWWKDHQLPPPAKPHMTSAVTLYKKGHITQHEFCSFVARIAIPEEIEEFIQKCPPELMEVLKGQLADYGPDESNWPRTLRSACYAPWVTAEEIEDLQHREQEQIWNGVRLLKTYLH